MPQLSITTRLTTQESVGAAIVNPLANMRIKRILTTTQTVGETITMAHFYLANKTDRFTGSAVGIALAPRTLRFTNRNVENDPGYIPKDEF